MARGHESSHFPGVKNFAALPPFATLHEAFPTSSTITVSPEAFYRHILVECIREITNFLNMVTQSVNHLIYLIGCRMQSIFYSKFMNPIF